MKRILFIVCLISFSSPAIAQDALTNGHISADVTDLSGTGITTEQLNEGVIGDAKWAPFSPMWQLMSCCRQFWSRDGLSSAYCYTPEMKTWMDNDSCNLMGF